MTQLLAMNNVWSTGVNSSSLATFFRCESQCMTKFVQNTSYNDTVRPQVIYDVANCHAVPCLFRIDCRENYHDLFL